MKEQLVEAKEKSAPSQLEIQSDEAGRRIDNFLIARLKGVPKSRIYRMLRTGEVRVNKGRVKPHYRLCCGDVVRLPPVVLEERAVHAGVARGMGRCLEDRVLYEDEVLLVLDKPAGMPVHGGSGLEGGVIEALRSVRPDARFLELVHRLDKDTSGCLLIAKKRPALRALHAQMRENAVDKRYLLLMTGIWRQRRRTVDVPLRKFVLQGGERLVRVDPEGKPSRTEFYRLGQGKEATLAEARLLTGRTHQIRVHAAWLGHPIAGDERYGNKAANRHWRRQGLKRLFLHAWRLGFRHPATGAIMRIEAPLEPELTHLLARLEIL